MCPHWPGAAGSSTPQPALAPAPDSSTEHSLKSLKMQQKQQAKFFPTQQNRQGGGTIPCPAPARGLPATRAPQIRTGPWGPDPCVGTLSCSIPHCPQHPPLSPQPLLTKTRPLTAGGTPPDLFRSPTPIPDPGERGRSRSPSPNSTATGSRERSSSPVPTPPLPTPKPSSWCHQRSPKPQVWAPP